MAGCHRGAHRCLAVLADARTAMMLAARPHEPVMAGDNPMRGQLAHYVAAQAPARSILRTA